MTAVRAEDATVPMSVAASRRRLWTELAGIAVSSGGFGLVYGLTARNAGFSPAEAMAMSVFVFAGASQFAAIGLVSGGLAWPAIALLTALLNARHLLYSAALSPWLRDRPFLTRAAMAFVLTDEAFALSIAHFHRTGMADDRGYWTGAILSTFVPWNLMTLAGVLLGGQIADPTRYGLDVVFPAAMAGLAVGLVVGQRELVAAIAGAVVGVGLGIALAPSVGIVAGGLAGPLVGMAAGHGRRAAAPAPRPDLAALAPVPRDDLDALEDAEAAVHPRDEAGLP